MVAYSRKTLYLQGYWVWSSVCSIQLVTHHQLVPSQNTSKINFWARITSNSTRDLFSSQALANKEWYQAPAVMEFADHFDGNHLKMSKSRFDHDGHDLISVPKWKQRKVHLKYATLRQHATWTRATSERRGSCRASALQPILLSSSCPICWYSRLRTSFTFSNL